MCGIVAYVGKRKAAPILVDGLRSLEYRGYDSAGIFMPRHGLTKAVGPVNNLAAKLGEGGIDTSGISHTRWATHGVPSEINAHPHSDELGDVWIVHNGIIENYKELKDELSLLGYKFSSETDSEVVAHLIAHKLKQTKSLEKAVSQSVRGLKGTYGLAIMNKSEPGKIVAARMGSPLVIGLGDGEYFIASDPAPILRYTKNVIYLNDGEMAVITANSHSIFSLDNSRVERAPDIIEWNIEDVQKGGYEHFMLKEMMEAPEVVRNTLRGRLLVNDGLAKLGGLEPVREKLRGIKRIIVVGCGTAYYSGLVGEYMLEEYAGIPVEVEVGSEFRYRRPIIDSETALLAISQSGETADTLEAIREAKRKGALTLGIVNVVGSTIARETDAGVYNHAGPEIGVASTKAFISQLTALALFTLFLGRQRQMSLVTGKRIIEELLLLPEKIEQILKDQKNIRALAEKYSKFEDFLYLGRKYNYSIAYEGALKLKEISYVHAEGCGAGEMKHGPIAMIDENFPTIAVALRDSVYEKMISNIQEIKARRGRVIAIGTEGDTDLTRLVDDVIYVPKTLEMLSPILSVIPLQFFAYYFAVLRGLNVDKPRNLAKSVTVE
ncbi:MAG: glutamine--fructose-6-phosphate transaminase (isomerizing) [Candidatus Vogelbacteria bacterium]|nr:glutamine--fructose-6-phosphate transaminase (isomerizing) [Candidatus Vogelbacteria bacterium]